MTDIRKLAVGSVNSYIYLSPHTGDDLDPEQAIVKSIQGAKSSIYFATYSFTLDSIADAILDAHKRGVTIRGVADATMAVGRGSEIIRLAASGIDIHLWSGSGLMHDKVFVVDGDKRTARIGLGSYNWSNAAEKRNVEVLLVASGVQVSRKLAPALTQQIQSVYDQGTAVPNI